MLEAVSWKMYIEGAAAILGCYYGAVGAVCYRSELKNRFAGKKKEPSQKAAAANRQSSYLQTSFDELERLVREIDQILADAGYKPEGEVLLTRLRSVLDANAQLLTPAYRVAVFNHITTKAKEICGVRIDESDLVEME